ncbi:acetyltransferase [Bordetella pertussis]|nr:acetyltransferase [Bordetella pertussis]CFW50278.1 acetyltransferase [Bordetella pertussis]
MTLEVLEGNTRAQALYRRLGYAGYELAADTGRAMFWQKKLSA